MRSLLMLALSFCVGCIPLAADRATTELAQHEADRIGMEPDVVVTAVPCIGSPAAVFWGEGGRQHVKLFVLPKECPDWLRRAALRYEAERARIAMGRGMPFGKQLQPLYQLDAALHGPISLSSVWFDVLFAPEVPPRQYAALRDGPLDSAWSKR